MGKILEDLKNSYDAIGPICPIITDKKGNIIDGFHRTKIDPNWPKVAMEVDEIKKTIIALMSNLTRRTIGSKEIGDKLGKIKELTKWSTTEIANNLGMSERWVLNYLPQKYKDKTMSSIAAQRAATTDTDLKFMHKWEDQETATKEEQEQLKPKLFLRNIWMAEPTRPVGAGDKHFQGNTPPLVAEQCILKYSKEGDTILDPMAGSGTLIDLCKKYSRKIRAFDIKPMRDDVQKCDATKIDATSNSTDFVFAHWPYWDMVCYSDSANDLSNMNYKDFLDRTDIIFSEIERVLKRDGYFAVLIGDRRKNKRIYDLSADLSKIGQNYFMLFDKIVWLGKGQASLTGVDGGISVWRAKTYGFHLLSFDTLLVFKKVDGNG